MTNARFKEETSLSISLRHLGHTLDKDVTYGISKPLNEVWVKKDTKSEKYISNILDEQVAKIKEISKLIIRVGESDNVDAFQVNVLLKNKDSELVNILSAIYDMMRNLPKEDFEKPDDVVDTLTQVKNKVIYLSGTSLLEQVNFSGENRNTRLQKLLESSALNEWASVFRKSDEWTYTNLYKENESSVISKAIMFFEQYNESSIGYQDRYDYALDESAEDVVDNVIGEMNGVITRMLVINDGMSAILNAASKMIHEKGFNNFFKKSRITFDDVQSDYN